MSPPIKQHRFGQKYGDAYDRIFGKKETVSGYRHCPECIGGVATEVESGYWKCMECGHQFCDTFAEVDSETLPG